MNSEKFHKWLGDQITTVAETWKIQAATSRRSDAESFSFWLHPS
jgi:hypothetical protein